MHKLLIALLSACLSLPALAITAAPGYTVIMASNVVDAGGNALASGTATFQVMDASGHPMSVQRGGLGAGQVMLSQVSVAVVNGAFTAQVVDVSQTVPSFPCVALTITDNNSGLVVWSNNCLQPTGATYDLDLFSTSTTPVYPTAGDTVQGNLGVNGNLSVTGNLNMGGLSVGNLGATFVTAESVNGVWNAAQFPGADIGAKVNAAIAGFSAGTGTVRIPDGTYSFSTTIRLTGTGQHLVCGAGVTLNYTGSSDAIVFISPTVAGQTGWQIDGENGCLLDGSGSTGSANGLRIFPSNATGVHGMRIRNFANGAALRLDGANSVEIHDNVLSYSKYGIYMISAPPTSTGTYTYTGSGGGYAANAVHVYDNEVNNNQYGVYSANGGVAATHAYGNVYRDNSFENGSVADLHLGWDAHTLVEGNYFESSGVNIETGLSDNQYDIQVLQNYFTHGNNVRSAVELGYGWNFLVEDNYEAGGSELSSGCFVNIISGGSGGITGLQAVNARSPYSDGQSAVATNEVCDHGSPALLGAEAGPRRFATGISVTGGQFTSAGQPVLNTTASSSYPSIPTIVGIIGPISFWAGQAAPIGSCTANLEAIFYWPGGWSLCVNGIWTAK